MLPKESKQKDNRADTIEIEHQNVSVTCIQFSNYVYIQCNLIVYANTVYCIYFNELRIEEVYLVIFSLITAHPKSTFYFFKMIVFAMFYYLSKSKRLKNLQTFSYKQVLVKQLIPHATIINEETKHTMQATQIKHLIHFCLYNS